MPIIGPAFGAGCRSLRSSVGLRHHLYTRREELLGEEDARALMEPLPPVGWADVATKRDVDALAVATKRDLDTAAERLDAKIDAVADRLDAKIDAVEARLDAKIDLFASRLNAKIDAVETRLNTRIDAVEARLTTLLHTELRAQTWRFLTGLIAFAGVLVAAVRL